MLNILVALSLISLCFSNIHLNIRYSEMVEGEVSLDVAVVKQMYAEYNSPYNTKSDFRFRVFMDNLITIRNHNVGKYTWKQGINDFTDITNEEFAANQLMAPQICSATHGLNEKREQSEAAPDAFEWTTLGKVTAVKNQGSCGSCWAFSTVGAMESHWNILGKGTNLTFSEQQLVDCAGAFDNHGCNGGLPSHAFEYIRYNMGLERDTTYKYTAKNGKCVYNKTNAVAYAKLGSYNITLGDEKELAEKLATVGPMSVSFKVVSGFQNYVSGVYTNKNCGTTTKDVNHAVLATGYGTENGVKFWNVKNSWGATWGMKGYFKIVRDANMCAIAQCNAYPLIDGNFLTIA